jgi:TonB family protein
VLSLTAAVMLQAAGAASAPHNVTTPDWVRRAPRGDVKNYYPSGAYRKALSGRVTLSCKITKMGSLTECQVLDENPAGEGFGAAGLRMAALFKMRPLSKDGQPVEGGTVRLPLRWVHPNAPMDPFDVITGCYGEASARIAHEPTDTEAAQASAFYRALARRVGVEREISEFGVDGMLNAARTAALTPGPDYSPGFARCMTLYREQMAKTAR